MLKNYSIIQYALIVYNILTDFATDFCNFVKNDRTD